MPEGYEKIRDKFIAGGMSREAAEGHAARIYNAARKTGQKPVTGNEEKSDAQKDTPPDPSNPEPGARR